MSKSDPHEIHAPGTRGAIHLVMQGKGGVGKTWSRPGWLSTCLHAKRKFGALMAIQ
jgi:hypothetical protein